MKKDPIKLKLILVLIAISLISVTLANNIFVGNSENLVSFGLINFMSYLFFFFLPAELFFIYYVNIFNTIPLITITIITAIFAQICDYIIGYLASENIKHLIKPKRYHKYRKYIKEWGYFVIFIFNLSPFSSPLIILIAGIMRLKLRYTISISFIGLLIKYIILTFINGWIF